MKKVLLLLVIAVAIGFGWWAFSPLLFDDVVDEAFPGTEETSEPGVIDPNSISDPPRPSAMLDELSFDAPRTQAEINAMSEDERMEMERKIVEEFADMPDTVMDDKMMADEAQPELLLEGSFEDADNFHKGSGSAKLYNLPDGKSILRFENFDVTNGPDLRVYLVKEQDPTKDDILAGLMLGRLKGNIGNQNYELPEGVNPEQFESVVIFCQPYKVVFSVANLN